MVDNLEILGFSSLFIGVIMFGLDKIYDINYLDLIAIFLFCFGLGLYIGARLLK